MNLLRTVDNFLLDKVCEPITHKLQIKSGGKRDNFDIALQLAYCSFVMDIIITGLAFKVHEYFALAMMAIIVIPCSMLLPLQIRKIAATVYADSLKGFMNKYRRLWFPRRIEGIILSVPMLAMFIPKIVADGIAGNAGLLRIFLVVMMPIFVCGTYFTCVTPFPPNVARERKEAKNKANALVPAQVKT